MKETRQDAWTKEEDELLAETVLQFIKNGNTQLEAFKAVAVKLSRTPAACGFRWNANVRKKYEKEIELAKEERKKMTTRALKQLDMERNMKDDAIESAIQLLEKLKEKVPGGINGVRSDELLRLQKENEKLMEQLGRYQNAWSEMEKLWRWVDDGVEKEKNV